MIRHLRAFLIILATLVSAVPGYAGPWCNEFLGGASEARKEKVDFQLRMLVSQTGWYSLLPCLRKQLPKYVSRVHEACARKGDLKKLNDFVAGWYLGGTVVLDATACMSDPAHPRGLQ